MSNIIVLFGYMDFTREQVADLPDAFSAVTVEWLRLFFDWNRIVQKGNKYSSLSFSATLNTYEEEELIRQFEDTLKALPFFSCRLVINNEQSQPDRLLTYLNDPALRRITRFTDVIPGDTEPDRTLSY